MQARLLPVMREIVTSQAQQSILVEGALDLVAAVLRPSSPNTAQQIHRAMSGPVMALMMTSDDGGILQGCTEYLRCVRHLVHRMLSAYQHLL